MQSHSLFVRFKEKYFHYIFSLKINNIFHPTEILLFNIKSVIMFKGYTTVKIVNEYTIALCTDLV
jgi:hypothetical protein